MTISWYGQSCFKITGAAGQITIITDPFSKEIGLNPPRGNADIVTVSHDHYDHNNVKSLSGEPFVIDSPGEYEIKSVKMKGILSFHDAKEKESNTIYIMEVDKIKICHLGDLGQNQLTDEQVEKIGQVDVLLIPVGGKYTINVSQAVKVVEQIEPRIVIPMHCKLSGLKISLDDASKFLKEFDIEKKAAVNKLTLKKKDLTGKEMEVVAMKI